MQLNYWNKNKVLQDEMIKKIKQNGYEKILIWSACPKTDDVVKYLNENGIGIYGYIDRNYDREYKGIKVFDKNIIKKDDFFVFIGLEDTYNDIIAFMNENGYNEFENYWYPNRRIVLDGTENYCDLYGNEYVVGTNDNKISLIIQGGSKCIIDGKIEFGENVSVSVCWNSFVKIGGNCKFYDNCSILFQNKCELNIGINCLIQEDSNVYACNLSKIKIGSNATIGRFFSITSYYGNITIGDDCMFSSYVTIRCGNNHNLFDLTNKVNFDLKPDRDIEIGCHVWLGWHSTVMTGSKIGSGSMVGINSMVLGKKFPNNSCLAGSPAKVIKTAIAWRNEDNPLFTDYKEFEEFDFTNKED